jgi:DNA repair ATPase RecN
LITDLEIENYQSVKKASIRLGRFTVITGPTGSGKSGSLRALRLAAFNQRGNSFIRRGAKACKVAVGMQDEAVVVGIERGTPSSKDCYRVVHPPDIPDAPPLVSLFTKLGGGVPEEVTRVLRLSEVNFAGQFDSPYLLASSGAQVAARLGELTNISIILEAVREAERRKRNVSASLRHERERLAGLQERLADYRDLAAQRAAMTAAEEALASARDLAARCDTLRGLAASLVAARQEAATAVAISVPEVSLATAGQLAARRQVLAARIAAIASAVAVSTQAAADAALHEQAASQTQEEYRSALAAAGRCPACGQKTDPLALLGAQLFGR